MYRINDLKRNILCVPAEVIFHAPTTHTLDERMVRQNIIIAEERFIRQTLTSPLYEDILANKNKVVDDTNKSDLEADIYNETGETVVLNNGDIVNSVDFLSDAYKALWYQFLWKLAAESVVFMTVPEAFVQLSSAGIIHNQPQSSPLTNGGVVTPGLNSTKWLMDKKMMDRIDPLIEAMVFWICEHKADYPLYANKCASCGDDEQDGVAYKRKTAYIFGIYDEEEKDCCDGW